MLCTMQTGGYRIPRHTLEAAQAAGLKGLGVSIDGPQEMHDRLRGVSGSYQQAIDLLDWCKDNGLSSSVNTQITLPVIGELWNLAEIFVNHGVKYWQVQLTVPMGNAADNDQLILQPFDLLQLMPILADLCKWGREKDLVLLAGNNIGYFGPFEVLFRGPDRSSGYYSGCSAGKNSLGIEADGTVKTCPSLPRARYGGGNVREISLEEIWTVSDAMNAARGYGAHQLWGYCATCYYASVCKGGCSWMSDALFGKTGNNPYCHYRALELAKRHRRERVVKVQDAENIPFGTGRFTLIEESMPAKFHVIDG